VSAARVESGRYHEIASVVDAAMEASGQDYNIYIPIQNALGALGKDEMVRNVRQRSTQALETHLRPDERRDPDHAFVHGDPEFERLYPERPIGG